MCSKDYRIERWGCQLVGVTGARFGIWMLQNIIEIAREKANVTSVRKRARSAFHSVSNGKCAFG